MDTSTGNAAAGYAAIQICGAFPDADRSARPPPGAGHAEHYRASPAPRAGRRTPPPCRRLEAGVDQRDRLGDAVDRDEAAEARPLGLAEQHLVERAEPGAQRLEAVLVADGVDEVLQRLGVRRPVPGGQPVAQVGERRRLVRRRRRGSASPAARSPRSSARRRPTAASRPGWVSGDASGAYLRMKPQSTALSWALAALARFSSIAKLTTMSDAGGCPRWMCQTGLASRAAASWPGKARSCWWYSSTALGMTSK